MIDESEIDEIYGERQIVLLLRRDPQDCDILCLKALRLLGCWDQLQVQNHRVEWDRPPRKLLTSRRRSKAVQHLVHIGV